MAILALCSNQTARHGYAIGSFKNEEQGTAGFIGGKTRADLRCDCGTQIKRLGSCSYSFENHTVVSLRLEDAQFKTYACDRAHDRALDPGRLCR